MHLHHSKERSDEGPSYILHRILVILSVAKNPVISYIAFSSFYYRFSVISNEVRNPVISRFAIQDFTGCFEAMPLNMTLNASASE
ncbi:hypothetical protein SAMN06298224_0240 [Fibrobacter sp. UWB16]|uniref:hypothetical protein n=1 Tax=Fibrobacter sp. UWB16 TaxID=1945874 RepID=UPI000BDB3349|nr:hypothetical protein [Fibrobacter sp. UWB16]SOD11573.1 hypothetical protein SAMN06298224_0240 [Fibrobacter sp. UWB16]